MAGAVVECRVPPRDSADWTAERASDWPALNAGGLAGFCPGSITVPVAVGYTYRRTHTLNTQPSFRPATLD